LKLGTSSIEVSALALGADLIGTKIDRDQSFLLFEAIAIGSARHALTSATKSRLRQACEFLLEHLERHALDVFAISLGTTLQGIKRSAKTLNLLRSSGDRQSRSVGEHSVWPLGRKPR